MRKKGEYTASDERILGSSHFVRSVLKEAEAKHLRQLNIRASGKTLSTIIREECKKHAVSLAELQGGGRRHPV